MVEREAKLRETNFLSLTQHLATKEGAFNALAHSAGGGRHEEGSRWWAEHHWQQSMSCSVTSRVRGPGGTWAVCDPHRMRKCGCVIYTLQTAGDVWGGAAAVDFAASPTARPEGGGAKRGGGGGRLAERGYRAGSSRSLLQKMRGGGGGGGGGGGVRPEGRWADDGGAGTRGVMDERGGGGGQNDFLAMERDQRSKQETTVAQKRDGKEQESLAAKRTYSSKRTHSTQQASKITHSTQHEQESFALQRQLLKIAPQCQVHALIAPSTTSGFAAMRGQQPPPPIPRQRIPGLYVHTLPPMTPVEGGAAHYVRPSLILQAAAHMLGHAQLGTDLHTAAKMAASGVGRWAMDRGGAYVGGTSGTILGAARNVRGSQKSVMK